MAQYVVVPPERLAKDVLRSLLEEYASRDGTDYGAREHTLPEKVAQLEQHLRAGELHILYEEDSEQWDLLSREQAELLLDC